MESKLTQSSETLPPTAQAVREEYPSQIPLFNEIDGIVASFPDMDRFAIAKEMVDRHRDSTFQSAVAQFADPDDLNILSIPIDDIALNAYIDAVAPVLPESTEKRFVQSLLQGDRHRGEQDGNAPRQDEKNLRTRKQENRPSQVSLQI